jgi:hypothetical protein
LYIADLAGMQSAQKIIGYNDKYRAYSAQKHPKSNRIAAGITGLIAGKVITISGILAYPLLNNSMKPGILGSIQDICSACANNKHVRSFIDLSLKTEKSFNPEKNSLSYWKQRETSYLMDSVDACTADSLAVMNCRASNYGREVWNTLSDNYMLVGAIGLGLVALLAHYKMNTYAAQERKAEEDLKKDLTIRFQKTATRLKALETNPEVQECARNILHRQMEIHQELEVLQLPTLAQENIEQITKPLFDAAKKKLRNQL